MASYVWGLRYIDDLVLREKGEERLYSLADPNWNVVALIDSIGEVQERMKYDAFGKITWLDGNFVAKTESDFAWNRTFTGQVLDVETGLMLYRNRFYHVELGRFLSRDPIGYEGKDNNLYRYVFNKPLTKTDPLGLKPYVPSGDAPGVDERVWYDVLSREKQDKCCSDSGAANPGAAGTIVCCDDHAIPCFHLPPSVNPDSFFKKVLQLCTIWHELQHIKDMAPTCDPCKNETISFTQGQHDSGLSLQTECDAYAFSEACFNDALKNPLLPLTAKDKEDIKKERDKAKNQKDIKCKTYNQLLELQ